MHRNSNNIINGWETDAYIYAITFPEKADRENPDNITGLFISNGSYLRKNDKIILHSLSKVFIYAAKEGKNIKVNLQGQPLIHASLRMAEKPQQVILNNQKIQPVYNSEKKLVLLDLEEKQ